MRNKDLWASFDEVYCLTLEGDIERQRHASAELCSAGLRGFKFIDGVKAGSEQVSEAYTSGKVHAFPPCFRCGAVSCGNSECNNVLIEPQVGCFLSFIKIFKIAAASASLTFLMIEDDVKFFDYAHELAAAALCRERLLELGFFSAEPCLIGLGRGISLNETFRFDGTFDFLPRRKLPQNPCFAFNRAFAELALAHFDKIYHTVDVFIHFQISDHAQHYSLEPPLSYELSTSKGTLPSRIHPKQSAFEIASNSDETRAAARFAFDRHLKHVKRIPLAVIGNPRGGTGFMAQALKRFGLDIGHEALGVDGISSWLFAVPDTNLPFGEAGYACNSRFVSPEKTVAIVRTSPQAILSMQIENSKNIQSYCYRKKWINTLFDVDLDMFKTDFERALAAYVFWYRIVALRKPVAWICLERAGEDVPQLFSSNILQRRLNPDPVSFTKVTNVRKPYFGQRYDHSFGDFAAGIQSSDTFLVRQYRQLQMELHPVFFGRF